MLADWVWRRQVAKVHAAFEALDADRLVQFWPDDVVIEFQPGTPMAGEWRGQAEVTALFRALFAQNVSLRATLHHVAVQRPWSPTGTCTALVEWSAVERGSDGHTLDVRLVSVAELRHWKTVRTRDFFFDVPGVAAHFATVDLPPRQATAPATPTAA